MSGVPADHRRAGTCSVDGCDRRLYRQGLCRTHHARMERWGDVRADLPIRQQRGSISERFWKYVTPGAPDECWEWGGGRNSDGYGTFFMGVERGGGKAHRVAWELANRPIPDGLHVLHSCDNPPCVNPAHLSLGTPADNTRDKVSRGRQSHAKPRATLTPDDVRAIREERARGVYLRVLAERYGVTTGTVSAIEHRKKWRDVD